MSNQQQSKSKYWVGVLYPENMIEDWQERIGDIVQVAYAYCVHNKDLNEDGTPRKEHVHLILVFPNTTTYRHALSVFRGLNSDDEHSCINTCQRVISIRNQYDYLIHNTEDCKKKNKYLYNENERVCGNNFDIGNYEQLALGEKIVMRKALANLIRTNHFLNFDDFDLYVSNEMSVEYYQIMCENQSYFNNLIRGHYIKWKSIASGEYNQILSVIGAYEENNKEQGKEE